MAANSWALACLWLALGQTPSDILVTNQRSLSIPVNIQDAQRAALRELLLYASNDQGRNWQQVAAIQPTQNAFTFHAPIDGAYWLRVAVVNSQGKQEPENIFQAPVDQRTTKVVIDTMKPVLRMSAPQRQGDDVTLAWELQEDNPEWSSFRLEYQAKNGGMTWTPITATAGLTGQARFRPTTQAPIAIRLSFKDQAGNQAVALADVAGSIATTAFSNPQPQAAAPPAPTFPGQPAAPLPAPVMPDSTPLLPSHVEMPKLPAAVQETAKTFPMNPTPFVASPWNAPGVKTADAGRVVASAQPVTPVGGTQLPVVEARRPLPALRYVNHSDVTMEYELKRVGPSGVGSVELWLTQNDGQTWERLAEDPEINKGFVSNGKHKRTLDLPGDGIYGFTLVVKSKAGLGQAPPRPGDTPEIRVEVDTTVPKADLYEPRPDGQKPNTLLLTWSASDKNLSSAPIHLEWSEKREGPWREITAPLANTGRYSWSVPERLPVQVYLRLRVRDLAGNESVAITSDPQLIDLSQPEGKLLDVSVTPR